MKQFIQQSFRPALAVLCSLVCTVPTAFATVVAVQANPAPASFTTVGAAGLSFPSFYQKWMLPSSGRGVVECTLSTLSAPSLTFGLVGDGALDCSNMLTVSLGGGTAATANSISVAFGVAPAAVAATWSFNNQPPIFTAPMDVRFEINQDIKLLVVKTKPQGADASAYATILTFSDYTPINGVTPNAFGRFKGNANYFSFGSLAKSNIVTNVVITSLDPVEPAWFTQKIADTDTIALSSDANGAVAAYAVSMNETTLTTMNQVYSVSDDITQLLNTWQSPQVLLPGLIATANRIACFCINSAKQCFVALMDGSVYKAPAVAGPYVLLAGINKGKPLTIASGQADTLFMIDQADALWRISGNPVVAVQEIPQAGLKIIDVSQGSDGTVGAIDSAGILWIKKAAATTWAKFTPSTVTVGTAAQPLLLQSINVVNATNMYGITMQQQVAVFNGTAWSLMPSENNPQMPAYGFVSVTADASGNVALFDADGNLYTNFPQSGVQLLIMQQQKAAAAAVAAKAASDAAAAAAAKAISDAAAAAAKLDAAKNTPPGTTKTVDIGGAPTKPTLAERAIALAYNKYAKDYATWNTAKTDSNKAVLDVDITSLIAAFKPTVVDAAKAVADGATTSTMVKAYDARQTGQKNRLNEAKKKAPAKGPTKKANKARGFRK